MKGQPIPLYVPRRGITRSDLPHQVGNDFVVDGLNMLVTRTGRYGARPGYVQYGEHVITEPIRGGIFLHDVLLAPRFVVGTSERWYTYSSGTDTWLDISSSGDLLTAEPQAAARFTTFYQNSKVWVLGCNDSDQIKRWEPGTSAYLNIPSSYPAIDMTVLANRVVLINTFEAGVRSAARVRWSAESDATTYPALGFFDLSNAGEPNVAIHNLSRTTAALYRTNSIWLVHAVAGGDATAFYPEQVSSGSDGPVGAAAVVAAGRSHYYLARDFRVYRFDGVEPVAISEPIDDILAQTISPNYWRLCNGTYMASRKELWWWVVQKDETEPKVAFVYDLDTQRWEVEQRFQIGVMTSLTGEEQRTGAWDDDEASWDSDETAWNSDIGEPELVTLLGTASGEIVEFGRHTSDAGDSISVSWTLPMIYVGESNQILPDEVENFFRIVENSAEPVPQVDVSVYGLKQPLGPRTLLFSGPLDLRSLERLILSSGDTSFDTTNYYPALQVEYAGSTPNNQLLEWGGGHLVVYSETDG